MASLKIVLTGDLATGKTSLIKRFVEGSFDDAVLPSICDSLSKTLTVNGNQVEVELWDTAGQERFRTVTSSFYKGAKIVAFVYDMTKKETFDNLQHWLTEVDRCAAETAEKILIANKSDLAGQRTVSTEDGKEFADEIGIPYFETSAKTGDNVNETFEAVVKNVEILTEATNTVPVSNRRPGTQEKKKSTCILL
uniref:Uncharacterized protein n=1 Tax=Vannella robusta TaxID=1487602 RepID=A0A7S4ISA4_9EUKA